MLMIGYIISPPLRKYSIRQPPHHHYYNNTLANNDIKEKMTYTLTVKRMLQNRPRKII